MENWSNWLSNVLPLVLIVVLWVFIIVWARRTQRRSRGTSEKLIDLAQQQLAALRETNELLKKLIESRR